MPVAYPIIITRMIAAANIPPGTFRLLRNPPADAMKLWMPELVFSNGGKGASSPIPRVVGHRLQSADRSRSPGEQNRGVPQKAVIRPSLA